VYLWGDGSPRLVHDLAYARQLAILTLGYENRLMTGLAAEVAREVQIMAGKILMYEENFHHIPLAESRARAHSALFSKPFRAR
jgi:hypothetical protein